MRALPITPFFDVPKHSEYPQTAQTSVINPIDT